MKKNLSGIFVALGFLACSLFSEATAQSSNANEGIIHGGKSFRSPVDVSNQYFIVFHNPPTTVQQNMVVARGATILYKYSIIPAYAVRVPSTAVIDAIKVDPSVKYVEPVQVYHVLGDQTNPEVTDNSGDQSLVGNGTQDILSAWIEQLDNDHLQFTLKVRDLSTVNPQTGDGLPVNGIWKINFSLQQAGKATADVYFVEVQRAETGPPKFNYGYVDAISFTAGAVDEGTMIPAQGIIRWKIAAGKFTGAPNANSNPRPGDVLKAVYAQTQQLVGIAGTGALAQIDRAPNTGNGRDFVLQNIVPVFSATPSAVNFGNVLVGQTSTTSVLVKNNGSTTMSVSSVTSNNSSFTVSPTTASIPSGGSQSFSVSFLPTGEGTQSGTISFAYSGPGSPGTVSVSGAGVTNTTPPPPQAEAHPYGIDTVHAPAVWGKTKGRGVKVAVLDTGIDSLHYELDGLYKGGYDFVNSDPYPWDGHSHGTHVAGTIAAEINNVGVVGVAPEVDIYALKVLSDEGSGSSAGILAAIDWCVQNDIDIANMSLGGGIGVTAPTGHAARVPVYSPTEEEAYQAAYDAGLLIVVATGNDGQPTVMYPAAYQATMAVGSVDSRLIRATTSNYGADLEIVAPGVEVKSTVPRGTGSDARVQRGETVYQAIEMEFAPRTSSSGITRTAVYCGKGLSAADFPASVVGNIALIERGDSSFGSKVSKAQDAGAVAVIIYNNAFGNFNGTLGTARDDVRNRDWVPAISLSQADGQALVALGSTTLAVVNTPGDFNIYSGTSMATPHVSGVAALCKAANPDLTNQQIRDILNQTTRDLGIAGYDPEYGNGLVDAAAAVARATTEPPSTGNEGTISPQSQSLSWQAGPFTGTTTDPVSANCGNSPCDLFTLHVVGTDPNTNNVTVTIEWSSPTNDLDLHVIDAATGNIVRSSGASVSTTEQVTFPATPGTYTVQALIYRAVEESYTGRVTLGTVPPEPPVTFRSARYDRFDFKFTPDLELPQQQRSAAFVNQDVEPEIEIDRLGTIYIGAIRGIPGGVDFWRSDDAGQTFLYLGQPDGTQRPIIDPPPEGGLGGGDVDIAMGDPFYVVPSSPLSPGIQSPGRLYVTSLWLGSATLSVSTDRGETWVATPFTSAQLDRQWNVAHGEKTLYMSMRKAANILVTEQHSVYVVQSDDGLTFTKGSYVQDPATGIHEDVASNIVLTSKGAIIGAYASLDGKDLYVYRTPKEGETGPADLPPGPTDVPVFSPNEFEVGHVFHGPGNLTTNNTFPILALDEEDNIHLVFGDRQNIYLISCPAGKNPTVKANWTKPLILNAPRVPGFEFTRTTMFPWIKAGKAGTVSAIWYGTDAIGDPDSPGFETNQVPWKIIYAQVENVFSDSPYVFIDIASKQGGGIIHKGQICVRGTGCPDGTRELAEYSSLALDKDGYPNIAYSGTIINGADPEATAAITFFTKGTARPVLTPIPVTEVRACNDSAVNLKGGWHTIEDDRATDGEYCRNISGKPNGKVYMEFQYSGTNIDIQIARGPRGGNFEVIIDGVSHGTVDLYRAPADPTKPDQTGKKDLTFGEFISFATEAGTHTMRIVVLNNAAPGVKPYRDIMYIDGFIITNGTTVGIATETESTTEHQGYSGPASPIDQLLSADGSTKQLTAVLEGSESQNLDLLSLDPLGIFGPRSATDDPLEVVSLEPVTAGSYTFRVVNTTTQSVPYTLYLVTSKSRSSAKASISSTASVPAEYALGQNYPNPFNPVTSIDYAIPRDGRVQLKIFDVYGREVALLVDREQTAGRYRIGFDAVALASGVYFYKLVSGNFTAVKRMVLLK